MRPDIVFRENVTGNADGQLTAIIPPLERLGYRPAVGIFAASETGASHKRQRLFILAYSEGYVRRGQFTAGEQAKHGRPMSTGNGEELANSIGSGHHGGADGEVREKVKRTAAQGPGGAMADAGREGLQDTQQPGQPGQAERGIGAGSTVAELCRAQLPLSAPGPSDGRWGVVLGIDPGLAPSVPRYRIEKPGVLGIEEGLEPAFRRMAHGLAYRNDRLRLCGNGVFPLEGAYAFRTLSALLDADREGRRADGDVLMQPGRMAV